MTSFVNLKISHTYKIYRKQDTSQVYSLKSNILVQEEHIHDYRLNIITNRLYIHIQTGKE